MAYLTEKSNYRLYSFDVGATLYSHKGSNCPSGAINIGDTCSVTFDCGKLYNYYGTQVIGQMPAPDGRDIYETKSALCFFIRFSDPNLPVASQTVELYYVTPESSALTITYVNGPLEGEITILSDLAPTQNSQLQVHVEGMTDLMSEIITSVTDPGRWANGRRNASADLVYDTTVKTYELIKEPTVNIQFGDIGGNNFSEYTYQRTGISTTAKYIHIDVTNLGVKTGCYFDENEKLVEGRAEDFKLAPEDVVENVFTASYSRTGGVCEEVREYHYVDSEPRTYYTTGEVYKHMDCSVGGGSISIGGGYTGGTQTVMPPPYGGRLDVSGTTTCNFVDVAPKETISYGNCVDIDGTQRNDINIITGLEQHVTEGNEIPTLINIVDNGSINYKGCWSLTSNAITSGVDVGYDRVLDLPNDVGLDSFIDHGNMAIKDLDSELNYNSQTWSESSCGESQHPPWNPLPTFLYDENGKIISVATGPDYPDGKAWNDSSCYLSCSDWYIQDAIKINIAPEGIVATPFKFNSYSSWSNNNCHVDIISGVDGYIEVSSITDGAYTDLTTDIFNANIRLTGTRFAKVNWYSSVASAEVKLYVGGHCWNLKAGNSVGSQVSLIDLCIPDSSTVSAVSNAYIRNKTVTLNNPIETAHPLPDQDVILDVTFPEDSDSWQIYLTTDDVTQTFPIDLLNEDNTVYSILFTDGNGGWYNVDKPSTGNTLKMCIRYDGTSTVYQGLKITQLKYVSNGAVDANLQQSVAEYELPLDKSFSGDIRNPDYSIYKWEFPKGWGVGKIVSVKIEPITTAVYRFKDIQLYRKTSQEGGFAKVIVLPHQPAWNDTRDCADFSWTYAGQINSSKNTEHLIPKAYVIIDGAVVLEILSGKDTEVKESNIYTSLPAHIMTNFKLNDSVIFALPFDDYISPSGYDVNGVVNIQLNPSIVLSEFLESIFYATYLVGGVYDFNSNTELYIPWRLLVDKTSRHVGEGNRYGGLYKVFGGTVYGVTKPNSYINVSTTSPSTGKSENETIKSNSLGFFISQSFNTKAELNVSSNLGNVLAPVRARLYTRIYIDADSNICKGFDISKNSIHGMYHIQTSVNGDIKLYTSYDNGSRWNSKLIKTDASIEYPKLLLEHSRNYPKINLIYQKGSSIIIISSINEGDTWSEEKVLVTGSCPSIYSDSTGLCLLFYVSNSNLYCARSTNYFETFLETPYIVIQNVAEEQVSAVNTLNTNNIVLSFKNSSGNIVLADSIDNGKTFTIRS